MGKEVKILTLDTETYNGLAGSLKRIAIYDGIKVTYGYTYWDVEPVIEYYYSMGYEVHVYIHNMEFDLRKIPMVFDKDVVEWKKSMVINRRFALLKNKHCSYHDSYKILPSSLASLSKDFEVPHGKLDLWEEVKKEYCVFNDCPKNVVEFLDKCHVDNEIYLRYLGYDVMSLYEVIYKLMHMVSMEEKEFVKILSTASLSRRVFKKGIGGKVFKNPRNIHTDYEIMTQYKYRTKKDLEIENFLRMGYCGGRCEVFIPELRIPGYHYDLNSQYPYVMRGLYPVGKPVYTENAARCKEYFETWLKDREGMGYVNCSVYIPLQEIPPLPIQMGKLTFPCGHVYGLWSYEELEYGVKECGVAIEEYYATVFYVKMYPVFRNFIDYFYAMKEDATLKGETALRTLAKLIMNVGYGYTGMNRDDKTSLDSIDNIQEYKEICYADPEIGFIEVPAKVNAEYIQVQIASLVTSRARLVWLKMARSILRRGGRVYYGDTDSLVSDIPILSPDVSKTELGLWDLEGQPVRGLFLKPKVYCELFADNTANVKFKGVTKETASSYDYPYYEGIYRLLAEGKEDKVVVEEDRLVLRGLLYLTKQGMDYSHLEYRDKIMNLKKDGKRIVDYNANCSVPWYFGAYEDFEKFEYDHAENEVQYSMV